MTPHRFTAQFWDHATLWAGDDESMAGHTTDGGRVFGITRTRYAECDHYNCQPVVVIDPDSRKQVKALYDAYYNQGVGLDFGGMAEALRSLIAPPRPEEPTGLGAVVEDEDGKRWVRVDRDRGKVWTCDELAHWQTFDGITAVRVLSEGVVA